jgi:hypothetical protein
MEDLEKDKIAIMENDDENIAKLKADYERQCEKSMPPMRKKWTS